MTLDELVAEITLRHRAERHHMKESRPFGTNTPGFNQDFGAHDALGELLEWIKEKTKTTKPQPKLRPELEALLAKSLAVVADMTPEEREEMWKAQRESWVRGNLGID